MKKLILNNFISHQTTSITFQDNEKTLFDGESGSGKTSLFEAIVWALYGVGRVDNRSLVRKGEKKATVTLTLKEGDNLHTLERSITARGKHLLSITTNGVAHPLTGVKELQKWVETDLIGASYLLFVNSIAYLQGGVNTFVSQTAGRRKELLLEILHAGDFDQYYAVTKANLNEVKIKKGLNEHTIENLFLRQEQIKEEISDKKTTESSLLEGKAFIKEHEKELEGINAQLLEKKNLKERENEAIQLASSLEEDINDLLKQELQIREDEKRLSSLSTVEEALKTLTSSCQDLSAQIEEGDQKLLLNTTKHQHRLKKQNEKPISRDITSSIKLLGNQLEVYSSEKVCPSGDDCPYYSQKKKKIEEIQKEIMKQTEEMLAEKTLVAQWQKEYGLLPEEEDMTELLQKQIKNKNDEKVFLLQKEELVLKLSKKESLLSRISSKEGVAIKKEKKAKDLLSIKEQISSLEKERDISKTLELESQKKNLLILIDGIRLSQEILFGRKAIIEEAEKQKPLLEGKIKKLKKENKEISEEEKSLEILKEAFGSKGIKTVILDYLLPSLEDKINDILSQMSEFQVCLITQKPKTSGEGNTEGLYIKLINEVGQELDFDSYSGGEKLRITVAISEALASLTKKVGFRLIDEAVHSMNPEMTQSFVEVFEKLLTQYPQMLIISHIQEVKDLFDKIIDVRKNNGVSLIK